jgi:hypothetical protein
MGRGTRLSQYERGQIDARVAAGDDVPTISKALNRSRKVVKNYIENPETYGQKNPGGRPRKLSKRDVRHIVQHASNKRTSAMDVKRSLQLDASKSTVLRAMRGSKVLQHRRMRKEPRLTETHKVNRVECASSWLEHGFDWSKVVFSDEKKFNLDGPDGFAYYWHDLRKEKTIFSKRVQGGGSVMLWGCFGMNGGRLAVVSGRMNAEDYTELLETELLPFGVDLGGENWVFQQDNASIHDANYTHQWMLDNGIQVLPWPSCSPDLNPMENAWGILVRAVYSDGRQYESVAQLKAAIERAWSDMDILVLQKMILKMRKRLVKVVAQSGNHIGY